MNPVQEFEERNRHRILQMGLDSHLKELSLQWFNTSSKYEYSYHFSWLGRPLIQFPQDVLAMQELIWRVKPELIVETGIAHGGGLVFYASMLELLGSAGRVVGVDIELQAHNRTAIEQHPLSQRITLLDGSSTHQRIIQQVYDLAQGCRSVLVALDSNHTHAHVLQELQAYSPLVKKGSYLVVFDTIIEDMPDHFFPDRPWGKGNNPKTAVREFLKTNDRFVVDRELENKLLITVAPEGYLQCIKD